MAITADNIEAYIYSNSDLFDTPEKIEAAYATYGIPYTGTTDTSTTTTTVTPEPEGDLSLGGYTEVNTTTTDPVDQELIDWLAARDHIVGKVQNGTGSAGNQEWYDRWVASGSPDSYEDMISKADYEASLNVGTTDPVATTTTDPVATTTTTTDPVDTTTTTTTDPVDQELTDWLAARDHIVGKVESGTGSDGNKEWYDRWVASGKPDSYEDMMSKEDFAALTSYESYGEEFQPLGSVESYGGISEFIEASKRRRYSPADGIPQEVADYINAHLDSGEYLTAEMARVFKDIDNGITPDYSFMPTGTGIEGIKAINEKYQESVAAESAKNGGEEDRVTDQRDNAEFDAGAAASEIEAELLASGYETVADLRDDNGVFIDLGVGNVLYTDPNSPFYFGPVVGKSGVPNTNLDDWQSDVTAVGTYSVFPKPDSNNLNTFTALMFVAAAPALAPQLGAALTQIGVPASIAEAAAASAIKGLGTVATGGDLIDGINTALTSYGVQGAFDIASAIATSIDPEILNIVETAEEGEEVADGISDAAAAYDIVKDSIDVISAIPNDIPSNEEIADAGNAIYEDANEAGNYNPSGPLTPVDDVDANEVPTLEGIYNADGSVNQEALDDYIAATGIDINILPGLIFPNSDPSSGAGGGDVSNESDSGATGEGNTSEGADNSGGNTTEDAGEPNVDTEGGYSGEPPPSAGLPDEMEELDSEAWWVVRDGVVYRKDIEAGKWIEDTTKSYEGYGVDPTKDGEYYDNGQPVKDVDSSTPPTTNLPAGYEWEKGDNGEWILKKDGESVWSGVVPDWTPGDANDPTVPSEGVANPNTGDTEGEEEDGLVVGGTTKEITTDTGEGEVGTGDGVTGDADSGTTGTGNDDVGTGAEGEGPGSDVEGEGPGTGPEGETPGTGVVKEGDLVVGGTAPVETDNPGPGDNPDENPGTTTGDGVDDGGEDNGSDDETTAKQNEALDRIMDLLIGRRRRRVTPKEIEFADIGPAYDFQSIFRNPEQAAKYIRPTDTKEMAEIRRNVLYKLENNGKLDNDTTQQLTELLKKLG